MSTKRFINRGLVCFFFCLIPAILPGIAACSDSEAFPEAFTLTSAIESALEANIGLKVAQEETQAADSVKKAQKTNFFPTFNTTYEYVRHDDERQTLGIGITRPEEEYIWTASITQPVFTGFSLSNQFKIADLGLDLAKSNEITARHRIIFEAKNAYFSVLKAQKLVAVSQQAVIQLEANSDVSKNFYDVGMIPLNDLLKSEVELANVRQELIVAQNNLEITEANFNTILRRPIQSSVVLKDILDYTPFVEDIDYCIHTAAESRPEISGSDLSVEIAEKELALARKDYYPTVSLGGTYFRQGTAWLADGGEGIYFPDGWDISARLSWNFWEWGRTKHGAKAKMSRVSQAQHQKTDIHDNIVLEVKRAYLKNKESEKNILAIEKAVEQAKENFRITEERYKEQMATTTDVLDAQTLLSKTMTNYYNSLYDFKISEAALYWAMGQEVME
ncbi:TolC family protein [Thermodesulfobacteriota bacterium]